MASSLSRITAMGGKRQMMLNRFRFKSTLQVSNNTEYKTIKKPHAVTKHLVTPQLQLGEDHVHIIQPPYAQTGQLPFRLFGNSPSLALHSRETVSRLRTAGELAAKVLKEACDAAKPGMTTDELDQLVHHTLLQHGAYPSPLNYQGFSKSVCSSVNEVVCHGIPDLRPLLPGDVLSLDVSCFLGGVHGDNCATVIVGDPSEYPEEQDLVDATKEALQAAIEACNRPNACLSHIGAAIEHVADSRGYSTVREYRGHGIGETFHCPPFVKHYANNDKMALVPGLVFTIEPMLVASPSPEVIEWTSDGWTVATAGGAVAAQFEHMVHVTPNGVEVLTDNPELNPSGLV